jgi:hypothetical protein
VPRFREARFAGRRRRVGNGSVYPGVKLAWHAPVVIARRRREWALAIAALPAAVLVGAVLNSTLGDGSTRDALLAFGGTAEFFGALGVAAPELVLLASLVAGRWRDVSRWMKAAFRRLVRRLFRRHRIVEGAGVGVAKAGGGAMGFVVSQRPGEDAPLEERFAYLYRRDLEIAEQFGRIGSDLADLPERWQADVDRAKQELREEHTRELERQRLRLRAPRLVGVGLLVAGVVLSTIGNLL